MLCTKSRIRKVSSLNVWGFTTTLRLIAKLQGNPPFHNHYFIKSTVPNSEPHEASCRRILQFWLAILETWTVCHIIGVLVVVGVFVVLTEEE